ncbi:hypothetical protein ACC786_20830 [Rhizobium ruizarguesonis]|uniref:hypothetical protein n=1 Tax=Rhizobium ruizarguesonis TaxID=2081791 RepID=UPI001031FF22|nr:hypothetical protein [Rhizobium ruizarguesonis]TAY91932.1 hypothetical protein ELH85_01325 [Rhizobium ruizarguesonis]
MKTILRPRNTTEVKAVLRPILILLLILFPFEEASASAEEISISSLDSLENQCPEFGASAPDAGLIMRCEENEINVRLVKKIKLDGASYIKVPSGSASEVLIDVKKVLKEDLKIESSRTLCEVSKDAVGRCKTLYILSGSRRFIDAALAINPKDDKIDNFSYFLTLTWERRK